MAFWQVLCKFWRKSFCSHSSGGSCFGPKFCSTTPGMAELPAVLGKPFQVGLERYCRIEPPWLGCEIVNLWPYLCIWNFVWMHYDAFRNELSIIHNWWRFHTSQWESFTFAVFHASKWVWLTFPQHFLNWFQTILYITTHLSWRCS